MIHAPSKYFSVCYILLSQPSPVGIEHLMLRLLDMNAVQKSEAVTHLIPPPFRIGLTFILMDEGCSVYKGGETMIFIRTSSNYKVPCIHWLEPELQVSEPNIRCQQETAAWEKARYLTNAAAARYGPHIIRANLFSLWQHSFLAIL